MRQRCLRPSNDDTGNFSCFVQSFVFLCVSAFLCVSDVVVALLFGGLLLCSYLGHVLAHALPSFSLDVAGLVAEYAREARLIQMFELSRVFGMAANSKREIYVVSGFSEHVCYSLDGRELRRYSARLYPLPCVTLDSRGALLVCLSVSLSLCCWWFVVVFVCCGYCLLLAVLLSLLPVLVRCLFSSSTACVFVCFCVLQAVAFRLCAEAIRHGSIQRSPCEHDLRLQRQAHRVRPIKSDGTQ